MNRLLNHWFTRFIQNRFIQKQVNAVLLAGRCSFTMALKVISLQNQAITDKIVFKILHNYLLFTELLYHV